MSLFTAASFDMSLWPLYLAGAIFVLGVWFGKHRRVNNSSVTQSDIATDTSQKTSPIQIAQGDAPTIRVRDSQRVDRLHRVVSLKAGEHVDLLELTFDRIPRLRISFIDTQASTDQDAASQASAITTRDFARIHVELGGAIAGCGSLVKEIGANQFLVPRATQDEHRCSILHFHGKGDVVNFLRVKIVRLNMAQQSADLDVLHVCGHWAA